MDSDGAGGKGTWGKLLDTNPVSRIDRNDPNYDSGEVCTSLIFTISMHKYIFFHMHK